MSSALANLLWFTASTLLAPCVLAAQEASPGPAASPAATPAPAAGIAPKYSTERLGNELALYTPSESPWAELKVNHALELRLFTLLRAEVRTWALRDELASGDAASRERAEELARILHGEVIGEANEALPLLRKTPNKPFAMLLLHELEAYPFEWTEEGSEGLLPGLHKLVDPPMAKPVEEEKAGGRRKRRKE